MKASTFTYYVYHLGYTVQHSVPERIIPICSSFKHNSNCLQDILGSEICKSIRTNTYCLWPLGALAQGDTGPLRCRSLPARPGISQN